MTIRRATMNDMQTVLRLYKDARKYMRSQGNSLQWGPSDMPEDSVITDLQRGQLFLGVDEADRPHYVFAFLLGIDHTYRKIKDGAWPNDAPYGTIHRVASDGTQRDVIGQVTAFCSKTIGNLRCDTHEMNEKMKTALERNGFVRCGIILEPDGTERVAYQRVG